MKKIILPFLVFILGYFSPGILVEQGNASISVGVNNIETNNVQWSYEGKTGPAYWGDLDPSYRACINGRSQSPINIDISQIKQNHLIKKMGIEYKPTPFTILNNGHTIQANAQGHNNYITFEGIVYRLVQFHFHTPSEHRINGQQYDMELHFVHQNNDGKLAVIGVLIQQGKENNPLSPIWRKFPELTKEKKEISVEEPIDIQYLIPKGNTIFVYDGSLTTPPCTEDVKWFVLKKPIDMSSQQIQSFRKIFPDNHRPLQPLNRRKIMTIKES